MVSWLKWPNKPDASDGREGPTVNITEAAQGMLRDLLNQRSSGGTPAALRVSVTNPGMGMPNYGMAIEDGPPAADDTVVDFDGIRVYVDQASLPEVTGATVDFVNDPLRPGFKVDPYQPPIPEPRDRPRLDLSNPLIAAVNQVIEGQVNPGIASHGGRATLIDIQDNLAYVELGGGCQGCSMASVTLKQGVERMIRQAVPEIRGVVDTTDHAGGHNPYFAGNKGQSPFQQAAKG